MEQRSTEWHEFRRTKVGASDAAPILGISPYKNIYQLYREKKGLDKSYTNSAMQRGIDLEETALKLFESETGYLMSPKVIVSPRNNWQMSSLDGLEIDGKEAVEIKCMKIENHQKALDGFIPEYYISQMQHQIEVTGLKKIFYCSYHPDHEKKIYIKEVYRDDDYIEKLIQKESEFYFNHLKPEISPDCPIKLIESDAWRKLANEYLRLDRLEKESAKSKEEIKDLLIQVSREENAQGNGISLQRIERKGIIPYASIPDIKEMDLEKYRKTGTSYWKVEEYTHGNY